MSSPDAAITGLVLDREQSTPLHAQLSAQIREMILAARLKPGMKLPASRILAQELGVSRITVTTSMDQLVAEGYLEGVPGLGLFVVPHIPDDILKAPARGEPFEIKSLADKSELAFPFQPSSHDSRLFPHKEWARLLEQNWRLASAQNKSFSSAGYGPLREAVARHLHEWRGLEVQPDQVFMTAGGVDAIQLIIRALDLSGRPVVLEDPGYPLFTSELSHHGCHVVHSRVDELGLDPVNLSPASMVLVTPSRHFPTGVTMPLSRRLDLLSWANHHASIIVEDDFDSEYRYRGSPLPTLMGQDNWQRVIYMGSFSKVFSPLVRLGYIVVPQSHISRFEHLLHERGAIAAATAQPALAAFMRSGRFATHIRRMRRIYAQRQEALLSSMQKHLSGLLIVQRETGGMHLLARLAPDLASRMSDVEVSVLAHECGISLPALSHYSKNDGCQQGLLMGYSGFDENELEAACIKLAELLKDASISSVPSGFAG